MTVATTTSRMTYVGNGSANVFDYTYKIFAKADLLVTVVNVVGAETTLALTTDYTVVGDGNPNGGQITLVNAGQAWLTAGGNLATGWNLAIRRVVSVTQQSSYLNQQRFSAKRHEDSYDYATMVAQQLQDEIDRTLRLPESEDGQGFSLVLPSAIGRANRIVGFDGGGNIELFNIGGGGGGGGTTIDVSQYAGATLGDKLAAAIAANPTGGVLDLRLLTGNQSTGGQQIVLAAPYEIVVGHQTLTVTVAPFITWGAGSKGSSIRGAGAGVSRWTAGAGVTNPIVKKLVDNIKIADIGLVHSVANAGNVAVQDGDGTTPVFNFLLSDVDLQGTGQLGVALKSDKGHCATLLNCRIDGWGLDPISTVDHGIDTSSMLTMLGTKWTNNALVIPQDWFRHNRFGESQIASPDFATFANFYNFNVVRTTYETVNPIEALEATLFVANTADGNNQTAALVGAAYVDINNSHQVLSITGTQGLVEHRGSGTCIFGRGVWGQVVTKGDGPMTTAEAFIARVDNDIDEFGVTHDPTITYAYGLHVYAPLSAQNGKGHITQWVGVGVENPFANNLAPSIAYAIYTKGGHVVFSVPTDPVGVPSFIMAHNTGQIWLGSDIDAASVARFTVKNTLTNTTGTPHLADFLFTWDPTANSSITTQGLAITTVLKSGNAKNANVIEGVISYAAHQGTGTVTELISLYGIAAAEAAGTLTTVEGVTGQIKNLSTGHMVTAIALRAATPVNSGGGALDTHYGLSIDDATAIATTAYAIYSSGGLITMFHNTVATSGTYLAEQYVMTINPGGNSTQVPILTTLTAQSQPGNTHTLAWLQTEAVYCYHYGTNLLSEAIGIYGHVIAGNSGGISEADVFIGRAHNQSTGTFNTAIIFHVVPPENSGGGTFQKQFGLYIEDASPVVSIVAYAIVTEGGHCVFNASKTNSDFEIDGDNVSYVFYVDASVDHVGLGINLPLVLLHLAEDMTLGGATADAYAAAIRLAPRYGTNYPTRHNYIELDQPTVHDGAVLGDAAIFRFDAALGTHKATTASDKTGNAKSGTLIVNVNGTLYDIQLYAH